MSQSFLLQLMFSSVVVSPENPVMTPVCVKPHRNLHREIQETLIGNKKNSSAADTLFSTEPVWSWRRTRAQCSMETVLLLHSVPG